MKKLAILFLFVFSISAFSVQGQARKRSKKNHITIQYNQHLEKRGTTNYYTSNPDVIFSLERRMLTLGLLRWNLAGRLGFYKEYVLTGYGWTHPEKTRLSLGLAPSVNFILPLNFRLSIAGIWDVLLPDDYDERWNYFAIEPSLSYHFNKRMYLAITATKGSFPWFDPVAKFDKAGVKLGVVF